MLDYGGYYSFGDFYFDGAPVRIGVYDEKGKAVINLSVSNEKLNFKPKLLAAGAYTVKVEGRNLKTDAFYYFEMAADRLFTRANEFNDDNWSDLAGGENAPESVALHDGNLTVVADEWVGFGDVTDFREITLANAAKLTFSLRTTDSVRLDLYRLEQKKDGSLALKKIKSAALNTKNGILVAKDLISNQLLAAGTYYVSVTSTNAARGGDAAYSLALNASSDFFTRADNGDDDWHGLAAGYRVRLDGATVSPVAADANEWVGFGDAVDYRRIEVAASGLYTFDLQSTGNLRVSVCIINGKGALQSIKTVTVNAKGGVIKDLLLDADNTYYFKIEATQAARGLAAEYSVLGNAAGTTHYDNFDLSGDDSTLLDLAKKESGFLTFEIDDPARFRFESEKSEVKLALYRYDEFTNKLQSVALQNGAAALKGSYYLKYTAAADWSGTLSYAADVNAFRFLAATG